MGKKTQRKRGRSVPSSALRSRPSALWDGGITGVVGLLLIVTPFLFNPWLVQPSSYDRFYLIKDAFVLSVMALCVALWAVRAVWHCRLPTARHGWTEAGGRGRFLLVWEGCLIAFVVLGFFSVLVHGVPPLSRMALLSLTLAVLFYFFLSRSFSLLRMRRLLLLQVYVAGLVGLHCLAQYYSYEPGRFIGGQNVTSQAMGYLGQVMATGAYLAATVPVGVAFFFAAPSLKSRLSLALAVILSLLGLMATGSRAGSLGAVVGLVVFGLLALYAYRVQVRAHWRMAFAFCLLLGFLVVGVGSRLPVFERLQTTLARVWAGEWEVAIGSRPYNWRLALHMVADRPLLGHGLSSFWKKQAEYEARYSWSRPSIAYTEFYGYAHNEFLQVWAEMGTPALLVVLTGLAALAAYSLRCAIPSNPTNPTNPLYLFGLIGSLATITFMAFFSFIFHISSVVVPILLFASALTANPTNVEQRRGDTATRGRGDGLNSSTCSRDPKNPINLFLVFLVVVALVWSVREVTRPFRATLLENQGDILLGEEMVKGVGEARREAFEAAVWWYRQALEVYPESPHANSLLGVALTRLGRIPEAIEALERAMEIAPGAETYLWLGQAYVAVGEIDKARQAFETGRKIKNLGVLDEWLGVLEKVR